MAESILSSTTDALLRGMLRRSPQAARPGVSMIVEAEVIPRLHRPNGNVNASAMPTLAAEGLSTETRWEDCDGFVGVPAAPVAEVGERDVALLSAALLKQDLSRAWRMVRAKHEAGMDTERLAIELLGATARRLGTEWVADRCSFADVTLGTGYLHQLLRDLTLCLDQNAETRGYHHRVLLMPAPGEQHVLGLSILGESFRRRGWDVCGGPGQDRTELLALAQREHFDLIGFSVGADRWLGDLSMDIERFRSEARNRDLRVMVGGYAIDTCPELVEDLGADLTAGDARLAPDLALAVVEST